MMRALQFLVLFLLTYTTTSGSVLKDRLWLSVDSVTIKADSVNKEDSTIVKNQPDSITLKVVALLRDANDISDSLPLVAIKNYREALTINQVKDELWEGNVRFLLAKSLLKVNSKNALPQLLKADALFVKKNSLTGRAGTVEELARYYAKQGNLAETKKYYDHLYRIQTKREESVLAGNAAVQMTDIYIKGKNYKEAFKYADMAKNSYYRVCRADSLGSIYYRIASLKKIQKSPKSAEYYILSHALPYYRSADDFEGRLKSFDFLGHLYQDQKKYSQAKWFYIQANNQARLSNDTTATITSLINLGVVKILIGDLDLAKQDLAEAESLSENEGYSHLIKNARLRYSTLFKKLNLQSIVASPQNEELKISSEETIPASPFPSTLLNSDKNLKPLVKVD